MATQRTTKKVSTTRKVSTTKKASTKKANTKKSNVNEYVEVAYDDGNVLTRVYDISGDVITLYINWYGLVVKAYLRYSKKKDKYWISFPSYKNKDGEYVDLCYLEDSEVLNDYIISLEEGLELPYDSRMEEEEEEE